MKSSVFEFETFCVAILGSASSFSLECKTLDGIGASWYVCMWRHSLQVLEASSEEVRGGGGSDGGGGATNCGGGRRNSPLVRSPLSCPFDVGSI